MNTNSLFLIFLLFCMRIYSQDREVVYPDTVSVKEMIENFQEKRKAAHPIEFYDCINGASETNMARLVVSPFKIKSFGISADNCHAVWELRYSQLILKRILPIGMTEEQAKTLFSILAKKHGGDFEKGIFASWFTGKLDILDCPYDLFGEWVSKEKTTVVVDKGYVISQKSRRLPEGTMSDCKKELFIDDGCWWRNLNDISCLETFVNKNVESTFTFEKSYSLLLFTDLSGKSSIYILEPKMLGWLDKKIIKRLKTVIQLLPVGSFSYLETLSGKKFQGRYLKATYTYKEGWVLKDYIH